MPLRDLLAIRSLAEVLTLACLAGATAALFWIVPCFPLARLDDPSHWGVLGYAVTLAVIGLRAGGRLAPAAERRWMAGFLFGMPLIYLADWIRFGGSTGWLAVELSGSLLYGTLAWLSLRRPGYLPAGIAGHAMWDAAHHRRTPFVPDWYLQACLIVDLALGAYLTARLRRLDP